MNFSGGEPFLVDRGQYLGQMVQYCKEELQMPSVTTVSNGSLIRESWFQKYGMYSKFHILLPTKSHTFHTRGTYFHMPQHYLVHISLKNSRTNAYFFINTALIM